MKNENLALSYSDNSVSKGLALFTPGGDVVYCIDPTKQRQWHLLLCVWLQEVLGLPEPPHFLVPAYTATIDRWIDPKTGSLQVSAEAYPPVMRHQAVLNAIFQTGHLQWQMAPCPDELCNPLILETYRHQFPQLWEEHDLVMRFSGRMGVNVPLLGSAVPIHPPSGSFTTPMSPDTPESSEKTKNQGYILRLFVSGKTKATEQTLQRLHHLLEQTLLAPYTLKVIDVIKYPEQAELHQISATPTLLKVWPEPVRRIVGELQNVDEIIRILGSFESY